jgi:hypothetical protein
LRSFFIRLLQVAWVLSLLVAVAVLIAALSDGEMQQILAVLGSLTFLFSVLIIIQYLAFAELNPRSLFDGSLTKKNPHI